MSGFFARWLVRTGLGRVGVSFGLGASKGSTPTVAVLVPGCGALSFEQTAVGTLSFEQTAVGMLSFEQTAIGTLTFEGC